MTPRQSVELFHVVFLRGLVARLEDKALVALKGGCNLRFYFGSIRYSEDIDFDVVKLASATLKKKVDALLASPLITAPLAARKLSVDVSAPKQTETTQRWKLGVRNEDTSDIVRTKIEFARRGAIDGATIEPLPVAFLAPYGLPPFLAPHYPVPRAISQKIHALANRSEPQARDVFDLNLLLPLSPETIELSADERSWVPAAIENAISVSHEDFVGQVTSFLDPEQAALYEDRDAFDVLQAHVVERLQALG